MRFLRELLSARQDFGERILTQRLVIYRRWVKGFSPLRTDEAIAEQNKKLLLDRLCNTVNLSLEVADRTCVADGGAEVPCEDGGDDAPSSL